MLPLRENTVAKDPIVQFQRWFTAAEKARLPDVNAMTLSTAMAAGKPSARIVLLKDVTPAGFTFYTNYQSRKAGELDQNRNVSLTFFWPDLGRQVRIDGSVTKTSAENSDAYFASRPRISRLGAWASRQSKVLSGRAELESRLRELSAKYRGKSIPRPPHWGGYLVDPQSIEFWQRRPNRLHDRILYTRDRSGVWKIARLSP